MMKKQTLAIFSLLLLISGSCCADVCPGMQEIKPYNLPPGWSYMVGPDLGLENYHFSSAIHSLNGSFYYEQVICRYDACPSFGCPAFTLISDKRYQEPTEANPPWNHPSVLRYTLTCMPGSHNPAHCVFQ